MIVSFPDDVSVKGGQITFAYGGLWWTHSDPQEANRKMHFNEIL